MRMDSLLCDELLSAQQKLSNQHHQRITPFKGYRRYIDMKKEDGLDWKEESETKQKYHLR